MRISIDKKFLKSRDHCGIPLALTEIILEYVPNLKKRAKFEREREYSDTLCRSSISIRVRILPQNLVGLRENQQIPEIFEN